MKNKYKKTYGIKFKVINVYLDDKNKNFNTVYS